MMAKVCIGYGMSYGDFEQNTKIEIDRTRFWRRSFEHHLTRTENLRWDRVVITGEAGLSELFLPVGNGSCFEHMMIFPTLDDKKRWYTRDGARYLFNPPDIPLTRYNIFMDGNGVETAAPPMGRDPALVPGIPAFMRWWLLRYRVFDQSGIAKLRPISSEWWD